LPACSLVEIALVYRPFDLADNVSVIWEWRKKRVKVAPLSEALRGDRRMHFSRRLVKVGKSKSARPNVRPFVCRSSLNVAESRAASSNCRESRTGNGRHHVP